MNAAAEKIWNKNFIAVTITNSLVFLSAHSLMPTLPIYAQNLGATQAYIGVIAGSFFASAVLFRPFVGKALDQWNRWTIYIIGLLIIVGVIFAYNFAHVLAIILALRFIHGIGWSAATASANTLASVSIPKSRLAEGLGYYGLSHTFSMAVSPVFGLYIVYTWGFGSLFNFSAGIAVLALIILLVLKWRQTKGNLQTARSSEKARFFEKKALRPAVIGFFFNFTMNSIPTFVALSAARFEIHNIGFFFTGQALTAVVARLSSGRLVDKKGFNVAVIPGFFFAALCLVILSFAQTFPYFLAAAFAGGMGLGLVQPAILTLAVYDVPHERRGSANSTYLLGLDLSIGAGSAIFGVVANLAGYSTMYLLGVIPIITAYIIFQFTNKPRNLRSIESFDKP